MLPRTHRVDVYRPTTERDQYKAEAENWPAATTLSAVDCNLQPRRADLEQQGFGRLAEGVWAGFFPQGTALKDGDGIHVTEVLQGGQPGPERFRVTGLAPQGNGWDLEADLQVSQATFPGS